VDVRFSSKDLTKLFTKPMWAVSLPLCFSTSPTPSYFLPCRSSLEVLTQTPPPLRTQNQTGTRRRESTRATAFPWATPLSMRRPFMTTMTTTSVTTGELALPFAFSVFRVMIYFVFFLAAVTTNQTKPSRLTLAMTCSLNQNSSRRLRSITPRPPRKWM